MALPGFAELEALLKEVISPVVQKTFEEEVEPWRALKSKNNKHPWQHDLKAMQMMLDGEISLPHIQDGVQRVPILEKGENFRVDTSCQACLKAITMRFKYDRIKEEQRRQEQENVS